MEKFKKILKVVSWGLTIFVVVLMICVFVSRLSGKTPKVFGYSIYRIGSDSMTPSLQVGDIILSKKVKDFSDLELDDVITYNGEKGDFAGKSITHRIVDIIEDEGTYSFKTQGTKEGASIDKYPVEEHQIEGKMVCKIPLLGDIVELLSNKIVFLLVVVTPLLICLFVEVKNLITISKEDKSENVEEKN